MIGSTDGGLIITRDLLRNTMDNQAIRQLDQGVFLLSGPKKTLGILGYVVAIGFLVAAVTMYSLSLIHI